MQEPRVRHEVSVWAFFQREVKNFNGLPILSHLLPWTVQCRTAGAQPACTLPFSTRSAYCIWITLLTHITKDRGCLWRRQIYDFTCNSLGKKDGFCPCNFSSLTCRCHRMQGRRISQLCRVHFTEPFFPNCRFPHTLQTFIELTVNFLNDFPIIFIINHTVYSLSWKTLWLMLLYFFTHVISWNICIWADPRF